MVADAHHVVVSIGRLVIFGVCYIDARLDCHCASS